MTRDETRIARIGPVPGHRRYGVVISHMTSTDLTSRDRRRRWQVKRRRRHTFHTARWRRRMLTVSVWTSRFDPRHERRRTTL
jgi:hypothetical protein